MSRWGPSLTFLLTTGLLACSPAGPSEIILGPEETAIRFMQWTTGSQSQMPIEFIGPEVDVSRLPIGPQLESAGDLMYLGLHRLHFVDDAVVAHARMKDVQGSRSLVFTFWMEPSAGKWRVTGWRPDLTPFEEEEGTGLNRTRIPAQLLASSLRAKSQNDVVYVSPSEPDKLGGERDMSLRVGLNIRITQIIGRCKKVKVRKFLREKRDRVKACYGTHFADAENLKRGRMLFELIGKTGTPLKGKLLETTLIGQGFDHCVAQAISGFRPRTGGECKAEVVLKFRPE